MITNIVYVLNGGYPECHFDWDGVHAEISLSQNESLIRQGYVSVYPIETWANKLSAYVPAAKATLRGFTTDPAVVKLAQEMGEASRAGTFKPGPVES